MHRTLILLCTTIGILQTTLHNVFGHGACQNSVNIAGSLGKHQMVAATTKSFCMKSRDFGHSSYHTVVVIQGSAKYFGLGFYFEPLVGAFLKMYYFEFDISYMPK